MKHRVKCSLSLLATAQHVIHFTNIRTVVLCVWKLLYAPQIKAGFCFYNLHYVDRPFGPLLFQ